VQLGTLTRYSRGHMGTYAEGLRALARHNSVHKGSGQVKKKNSINVLLVALVRSIRHLLDL
jgi:hypothetical protein